MNLQLNMNMNLEERIEYLENNMDKYYYARNMNVHFKKTVDKVPRLKQLQIYANYLLKAVPKDQEYKYKVITQDQWNAENRMRNVQLEPEDEEIIMNQFTLDRIRYTNNDIKITKELLNEDSELGDILRDYEYIRKHLSLELQKYKEGRGNESPYEYGFIRRNLREIKADMILSVKFMKGLDVVRPQSTRVQKFNIDYIDYEEPKVIKELIKYVDLDMEIKPDNSLSIVAEDLRKTISSLSKQGKLDSIDMDIIERTNYGDSLRDIAASVGINHVSVNKRLKRITEKISKELTKKNN